MRIYGKLGMKGTKDSGSVAMRILLLSINNVVGVGRKTLRSLLTLPFVFSF